MLKETDKKKPGTLALSIRQSENISIGDIRKIISAIRQAGFKVEALPTEIYASEIKVTREPS